VDATYFTGGNTQINGVPNNELQRNWRVGVTLALPLSARNSISGAYLSQYDCNPKSSAEP
jgi:hypothetical protein